MNLWSDPEFLSPSSYPWNYRYNKMMPGYNHFTPGGIQILKSLYPKLTPYGNQILGSVPTVVSYEGKTILQSNPNIFPYNNIDTGLNDNYLSQKQTNTYLRNYILDKSLFYKLAYLLKYLKMENNNVSLIKSLSDLDSNDISDDTTDIIEAKSDFIAENILTEQKMRHILTQVVVEYGYKWYELANLKPIVEEFIGKYIKKKFKEMITNKE